MHRSEEQKAESLLQLFLQETAARARPPPSGGPEDDDKWHNTISLSRAVINTQGLFQKLAEWPADLADFEVKLREVCADITCGSNSSMHANQSFSSSMRVGVDQDAA
jgi:hypothetical protein